MRKYRPEKHGIIAAVLFFLITSVIGICGMHYTLLESARILGRDLVHSYVQDEELNISKFRNQISLGLIYLEEMNGRNAGEEEKEKWVRDYFRKIQEALPNVGVEAYAVVGGRLITENSWEGMEKYDFTESIWYRKAAEAKGEIIFTDAYQGQKEKAGEWVVSIAAIEPESGDGIVLDLSKETFRAFHANQSLPEDGAYYLCDANGRLLYGNVNASFEVTEEELESFAGKLCDKVKLGEITERDNNFIGVTGKKRGVYYSYEDNGWFCALTMTYDELLKGMRSLFGWYVAVFLLFLLTAALMGYRNRQLSIAVKKEREIVQSLGNSYYAFYRVNVRHNTYEIIKGSEYINERAASKGEYTQLLHMLAGIMDTESGKEFLQSFSAEKVKELIESRTEGFGGDFLRLFGEEYRWVNVSLLVDPVLGADEGVLCFRKIHEEMQHQREYQKLLEDVLETAEMNEKSQKQFYANMSHEMKTPLNIIIGMAEMAARPDAGKGKVSDCLERIKETAKQLTGLINDILEKSRLNQTALEHGLQFFDMEEAVLAAVEDFRRQAEEENKEFSAEIDMKDRIVAGNVRYLVQILNQLLSNAVKFTNAGDRITVKVNQAGEGDKLRYHFTVEDTGIGMAKEFLPKLFDPYATVKRFEKQRSGKGLGLAIVKNLVMKMGGTIHVDSELGKGSCFRVTLPFTAKVLPENAMAEAEKNGGTKGGAATGIAAEDAEKNSLHMQELPAGGSGAEKESGMNAQKEAETGVNAKTGKEAEAGVNAKAGKEAEAGVNAKAGKEAEAGINTRAEKEPGTGENTETEKEPETGADAEKENELTGCRILLAEDNPLNMEIAVELLHMAGAEVDCAENGQEAVELFERSVAGYYDAVVLDMRMPVLDGCGAAEAIRGMGRPDSSTVPIAALTANTLAEDMARTAQAGMNVHLAKPVLAEKLWDTLSELILESRKR